MQAVSNIYLPKISPMAQSVGAAAGVAVMSAGVAVVAYFDPTKVHLLPQCPLYSLTGFACPGCGLTRGFHALFHGDIVTAIDFNALLPIWAAIFGYVFVALVYFAVRGRWLPMWPLAPKFLATFLAVLIGFGILRNIPVWPFTILFP